MLVQLLSITSQFMRDSTLEKYIFVERPGVLTSNLNANKFNLCNGPPPFIKINHS